MTYCPIARFAKVDDDVWRGAEPDTAGVEWLLAEGCKTIISLEWEHLDTAIAPMVELRLVDWEPLPEIAPKIEDRHIRSFLNAVSLAAKPVFVHCRSGQNRTGVAIAAYIEPEVPAWLTDSVTP